MIKLFMVCGRCNGEGSLPEEDPCVTCQGQKYVESGLSIGLWDAEDDPDTALTALSDTIADLVDTVNDILDKCNDIFEAVTE